MDTNTDQIGTDQIETDLTDTVETGADRRESELSLNDKIMDFRYADDVKMIYTYSEKEKADIEIRSLVRRLKEGDSTVHSYIMDHYTKLTRDFIHRNFKVEFLPNFHIYVLLKK